MALREFWLPDVGEGVAEGEIVRWLVEVGDTVVEDQPIVEVETDKAIVEIPSPVDGTIVERPADEGDVVPVGDILVVIEVEGDEAGAAEAEPAKGAGAEPEAETGDEPESVAEPATGPGRVFAPPHVRRLARELGVDLSSIDGSGPSGRVTEGDVRAAAGEGEARSEAPEPTAAPAEAGPAPEAEPAGVPAAGDGADRDRTLAAPATRRLADELGVDLDAVPATEERDGEAFVTPEAVRAFAERGAPAAPATEAEPGASEERVPYRGIRRSIGEHMVESASTAPHVTHFHHTDVQSLVEVREELRPLAEERGIRLTYLPFVIKAVVAALEDHPYLNATLDAAAEEIVLKRYYNVGVATATDEGLLVPVIDHAERKGLLQLASEIEELTERARDRTITREEMLGGTFTITNVGAIGGEGGTPIINQPQVAILALGAIAERPWVVDGEVVARHTLPTSLSFDHRVVDGATGARFMNDVSALLEEPTRLLL